MSPLEILAPIGYRELLPDIATFDRDPDNRDECLAWEHSAIWAALRAPVEVHGDDVTYGGRRITWHHRVPDLVTWAGQQTLGGLIAKRQKALPDDPPRDVMGCTALLMGMTGLDPAVATDAVSMGWSPDAEGSPLPQYPARELLAIIGLEKLPLISFSARQCGFVASGRTWRFAVRHRVSYYYMWTDAEEVRL